MASKVLHNFTYKKSEWSVRVIAMLFLRIFIKYVVKIFYSNVIETHNSQHVVIVELIIEKCPLGPHAMPVRF